VLIDLSTYALFCVGALALVVSPGPDFFYVATRGIAGGRGAGVVSALGIGAGILVHTALAASGLTLLLLTSSAAFNLVKWLGALYLVWIGVRMLLAREEMALSSESAPNLSQVFRQGLLTNIFNPKVALTFLAFLPPFVQPQRGQAELQIAVLGATLAALATLWFCGVGFFAGQIGVSAARHAAFSRVTRLLCGGALVILGVRLAFLRSGN
jgi:threonine/homoserine/homoserine lactone efflux protein